MRFVLATILALAPASALAQGVVYRPGLHAGPQMLPAQLRSGTYSGALDWAKSGSLSYGPGIPTPTIDCLADSSGGGMTCSGATAMKAGSPTTSGPFWFPSGFSAAGEYASVLNGTDQWFNLPMKKCAAVGDSKMASGSAAFATFAAFMGCEPTNAAVAGKSSDDILGQWRASIQGNGFDILVVEGGVNDFNVDNAEPSVPLGNFTTLIQEAIADGVDTILWTNVGPEKNFASWTEAIQTHIEEYNAAQAAAAASLGVIRVDEYGGMGDPAAPQQLLAAYDSGDHLHHGSAGQTHFAVLLGSAAGLAAPGSLGGRVVFKSNSTTGYHYVLTKGSASADEWALRLNSGTALVFYGPNSSSVACGTVSAGAWNTVKFAYEYVEGGTHNLRCNLNGTAASGTTASGPDVSTQPFRIGARGAAGEFGLDGAVSRAAIDYGFGGSAAQLATMVASQQSLLAAKPAGAAITFSRDATENCYPSSTAGMLTVAKNTPCIESTGAGIWSSAAASNTLVDSDDLSTGWTLYKTTAPSAGTLQDTAEAGSHYAYQTYTATAAAWTVQGEFKKGTKHHIALSPDDGAGFVWFDLDAGTVGTTQSGSTAAMRAVGDGYYFCSVTRTMTAVTARPLVAIADVDGATSYVGDGSGTILARHLDLKASVAGPHVHTTSAPVSGVPTSASVAVTLTNPAKWCVGGVFVPPQDWNSISVTKGILALGDYASANSAALYVFSNGNMQINLFSGGGYRAWTQNTALAGSAEKRLVLCQNGTDNLTLYVNGVPEPFGAGSGSGTGLMSSMPSRLDIGSMTGFPGDWTVKKVCQATTWQACDRSLR